ncbi:28S ribosomal protein S18c, mitochondrial [Microplitis mediator]|uniref:28S ribosomal protein S18c, mitochondrial n=1 Tax=Microplitis mediator TaxID=375433 RepID=UPI00255493EF|nr:28S ribosomal protein S18c, mitochondrial [Microplitis mediator]
MALLSRNIFEISKYTLILSRRLIHNIVDNTKQSEAVIRNGPLDDDFAIPNGPLDEDLPIKMQRNPFEKEKKLCVLCRLNITPDWKNVRLLSQFQSAYTGRIYGRHITGLCKHKQELVEREILKAQTCGFMSVYLKDPNYSYDPMLFDPNNPFRPHKY